MKRLTVVFFALLTAVNLCSAAATVDEGVYQRMASILKWYYGPSAAESQMYVGAEMCLSCHPDEAGWRQSMHATAFKATDTSAFSLQLKQGVIADYDQNGVDDFVQGLDFNQIDSPFDKYKPNAPILGYSDATGYTITIGGITHRVKFAYGGSGVWKQRYMVKITTSQGPSAGYYASPVQYNDAVNQFTTYHPEHWWNEDGSPKITPDTTKQDAAAKGESFDGGCAGCHFTGLSVWKDANGEFRAEAPPATLYFPNDPHYLDFNGDRIKEQINTGCERCHGPGSAHVLGRGDPEKIINPKDDLTVTQANRICGACHTRGHSVPDHTFSYPYNETTNTPAAAAIGEDLDNFFDPSPGRWPDGTSPTKHRQQYLEYQLSAHAQNDIACYDCHDIHNTQPHHHTTEIEYNGIVVPTKVENNTECLACHAGKDHFESLTTQDIANYDANEEKIAKVTVEHTHHPYAPERTLGLSRCTECHLANVAKSAVPYDVSSHTFEAIPPEKTLMYQAEGGMPSSCAVRCHRGLSQAFGLPADSSLTKWNEPSDVSLAQWLMQYYGPEGKWWKTGGGAQ